MTTNVSVQADATEKDMIEAVCYDILNSSQSSGIKHVVNEYFAQIAGNIHPRAIRDGHVDVEALVRGELDPESVDDKYKMDGDGPAQVLEADGGAVQPARPESYTPTHTPSDLAQAGPVLSWDELKDAVDRHWSDDLEIHHDRVRLSGEVEMIGEDYSVDEYAIRSNQAVVAKILAGLCRSRGDIVTQKQIEATILQYTEHQISRADKDAGRAYKKEVYSDLVTEYFIEHPDPRENKYYTSEAALRELFPKEVEETIGTLLESQKFVLDPKAHAQRTGVNPKQNPGEWLEDLSQFRSELGFLHAVREDEDLRAFAQEVDDTVLEEYPSLIIAVSSVFTDLLPEYRDVNPHARYVVSKTILEIEEQDMLEVEDYDSGDTVTTTNPDRPGMPIMEWEQCQGEPLSAQARFEAVASKL